jgi:hypothetical protein
MVLLNEFPSGPKIGGRMRSPLANGLKGRAP